MTATATPNESWHLSPDLSAALVGALWFAVAVTLAIMIVRMISVHRAITRDPAASEPLRGVRKTLLTATLWGTLGSVAILLIILNGVHLRWLQGESEEAVVVSKKQSTRARLSTPAWIVTVTSERVGETFVYADEALYQALQPGDQVPVVSVSGFDGLTQLGLRPTVNLAHLMVAAFLLLVPIANLLTIPRVARSGTPPR